jgi:hypothetical protein
MRDGIGEFEPGDGTHTRGVLRRAFILALFEFDDKRLHSLVDKCAAHWNNWELKCAAAVEWTAESGLEVWWAEIALEVLQFHADLISSKTSALDPIPIARELSSGRIRFEHWDWDPLVLTRTEFLTACRMAFEKWLSDYLVTVEEWASKQGFVRTKEKRNRDHMLWLVRFHVGGESVADICRGLNEGRAAAGLGRRYTRQAVEKAIKGLARKVELPLRSSTL